MSCDKKYAKEFEYIINIIAKNKSKKLALLNRDETNLLNSTTKVLSNIFKTYDFNFSAKKFIKLFRKTLYLANNAQKNKSKKAKKIGGMFMFSRKIKPIGLQVQPSQNPYKRPSDPLEDFLESPPQPKYSFTSLFLSILGFLIMLFLLWCAYSIFITLFSQIENNTQIAENMKESINQAIKEALTDETDPSKKGFLNFILSAFNNSLNNYLTIQSTQIIKNVERIIIDVASKASVDTIKSCSIKLAGNSDFMNNFVNNFNMILNPTSYASCILNNGNAEIRHQISNALFEFSKYSNTTINQIATIKQLLTYSIAIGAPSLSVLTYNIYLLTGQKKLLNRKGMTRKEVDELRQSFMERRTNNITRRNSNVLELDNKPYAFTR
jgi:hypothetical protein